MSRGPITHQHFYHFNVHVGSGKLLRPGPPALEKLLGMEGDIDIEGLALPQATEHNPRKETPLPSTAGSSLDSESGG